MELIINFIGKRISPDLENSLIVRLMRDSFRKYAGRYAIAIFCMILIAATTSFTAWIMRDLTNSSIIDRDFNRVMLISLLVALTFTVKGFATYFQSVYLSQAGNAIIADQQLKLYDRLVKQDIYFFAGNNSSDLIVRVTHNAQAARQVIDTIVMGFVRDLFTLLGLVFVMVYQQPIVAVVVLIVLPIALFSVRVLLKRVRHLMEQELMSLGEIVKVMQETSVGIRVVKTFSLESLMKQRIEKAVRDVENRANSIVKLEAATSPIMEVLGGFSIAGMIALSSLLIIGGDLSPGELISFITAMLLAYEPAKRLARMRVNIETGLVGVRIMFELMDQPINLLEKGDAKLLPKGPGEIRFDSVTFNYTADAPVIENMDIVLPAGKTTALVGPSGGGKSTIINLLMRLYDPVSGRILIDGNDVSEATFSSLRDRISFVGQDTFLFSGTVAFNIGLGRPDATHEEIIEAAKSANAYDFIMAMPNGFESMVGDNGGNLSGGQKQRIAIARAILKDSEILILDEATSALDSHSEEAVREAIVHASQGRTTIMIAHRLSTISRADLVVYIEGGKVIESGSQAALLKLDGAYRKLHDKQYAQTAST